MFELHWVQATTFVDSPKEAPDFGTQGWETLFTSLNADMSSFNGFMHNKVQLYVPSMTPFRTRIEALGLDFMERKSAAAVGDGTWLHVGVSLAGRVVELVAPATDDTELSTIASWDDEADSCAAHAQTPPGTMLAYKQAYAETSPAAMSNGMMTPMLVRLTVATADPAAAAHAFSLGGDSRVLGETSREAWHEAKRAGGAGSECNGESLRYEQIGSMFSIEFVNNTAARVAPRSGADLMSAGHRTVADYDQFVASVHEETMFAPGDVGSELGERRAFDMRAWNHWQDQHIGFNQARRSFWWFRAHLARSADVIHIGLTRCASFPCPRPPPL